MASRGIGCWVLSCMVEFLLASDAYTEKVPLDSLASETQHGEKTHWQDKESTESLYSMYWDHISSRLLGFPYSYQAMHMSPRGDLERKLFSRFLIQKKSHIGSGIERKGEFDNYVARSSKEPSREHPHTLRFQQCHDLARLKMSKFKESIQSQKKVRSKQTTQLSVPAKFK